MSSTTFTPFYAASDLNRLFHLWMNGSLDGIHSKGHTVLGVRDCDRVSHGFRSLSLAARFTGAELKKVLESMAKEPEHGAKAMLLLMKHVKAYPIQDIARGLGYSNCSQAQSALVEAQDEFIRRLLAL